MRRCLRTLLRMSLLSGSIREGIQVHDLVRAYAAARMPSEERAALHRSLLDVLCAHPAIAAGGGRAADLEDGGAAVAAYLRLTRTRTPTPTRTPRTRTRSSMRRGAAACHSRRAAPGRARRPRAATRTSAAA